METAGPVSRKPNKWIAALLGLLLQPIGMLYVAQPGWAAVYFVIDVIIVVARIPALRGIQLVGDVAGPIIAIVCAIHAYRLARNYDESRKRPWYSRWYSVPGIAATAAVLVVGTRAFLFEPFRFPASSMAPSIQPRAVLIVKKWGYGHYGAYGIQLPKGEMSAVVQRGDIVVFEYPDDRSLYYAKRVIGLPGDRVSYHNKQLKINDADIPRREIGEYVFKDRGIRLRQYLERLDVSEYAILIEPEAPRAVPFGKPFPFRERCSYTSEGVSCQVPDAHYFVMGDNRDNSNDSRFWEFVPERNVVGRVQYIFQ